VLLLDGPANADSQQQKQNEFDLFAPTTTRLALSLDRRLHVQAKPGVHDCVRFKRQGSQIQLCVSL
jgi:hypothetical protein